ncbi:MAG: DUF5640 domain-containing protein [Gemmataceae bacterium]
MKPLFAHILGVATLLGLVGFLAADDNKKDDKPKQEDGAAKLVGKWEVTKTDGNIPEKAVVEFTKDGKFSLTIEGQTRTEGKYRVEKDKLITEVEANGQKSEDTDVIKKVTADTLELENAGDKRMLSLKKK